MNQEANFHVLHVHAGLAATNMKARAYFYPELTNCAMCMAAHRTIQ